MSFWCRLTSVRSTGAISSRRDKVAPTQTAVVTENPSGAAVLAGGRCGAGMEAYSQMNSLTDQTLVTARPN